MSRPAIVTRTPQNDNSANPPQHPSPTRPPEVVILCGGRGTRLAPDTDVIPKPLVSVGGRPILWHIMQHYARFGFNRFVLCLGYRGEMIRDYFLNYHLHNADFTLHMNEGAPRVVSHAREILDWEITFADTGMAAQTGSRIARVGQYVTSPYFLCTYGDGVSDINVSDLVDFHREHGRVATVSGVHPPARFGEMILGEGTRVSRFQEKPSIELQPRAGAGYVNGGFFVFDRSIFDYLSTDDACILEREPIERLAADGELCIFQHEGFWQCMDTPKDREMLDAMLQRRAESKSHSDVIRSMAVN
jgi:glucose-1-phosphate cytidylyltransferase